MPVVFRFDSAVNFSPPQLEEFESFIEKTPTCWIWHGRVKRDHPLRLCFQWDFNHQFTIEAPPPKLVSPVRLALELFKNLTVVHVPAANFVCGNELCIRPDSDHRMFRPHHLAAPKKLPTGCVNGHAFSSPHAFRVVGSKLVCRECSRVKSLKFVRNSDYDPARKRPSLHEMNQQAQRYLEHLSNF